MSSPVTQSPQSRPPPKPASLHGGERAVQPQPKAAPGEKKQRKAASARIVRPELPIHALYSQVYQEEGAPVPQSHPHSQGLFQKRSRPPSRHRAPQDSVGLEVQPAPIPPRMRSAHYPSHHERPPSRCKPPPQCVHLEDAENEEEAEARARANFGWDRSAQQRRPGSSSIGQRPGSNAAIKRPVSGTPSRTAHQGEFDNPEKPEVEDVNESSEEETVEQWGAAREQQQPRESARAVLSGAAGGPPQQHATAAVKKKPSITSVPFRTSLSEDFLRLFAPASTAAPPTPPENDKLNGYMGSLQQTGHEAFPENSVSIGLTDIPSPTDDLFGPFVDKEMFNKTFEDLCISDDDSEHSI